MEVDALWIIGGLMELDGYVVRLILFSFFHSYFKAGEIRKETVLLVFTCH